MECLHILTGFMITSLRTTFERCLTNLCPAIVKRNALNNLKLANAQLRAIQLQSRVERDACEAVNYLEGIINTIGTSSAPDIAAPSVTGGVVFLVKGRPCVTAQHTCRTTNCHRYVQNSQKHFAARQG